MLKQDFLFLAARFLCYFFTEGKLYNFRNYALEYRGYLITKNGCRMVTMYKFQKTAILPKHLVVDSGTIALLHQSSVVCVTPWSTWSP